MLNFEEYKQRYLNESNRPTRYYREYPHRIRKLENEFNDDDEPNIINNFLKKDFRYKKLNGDINTLIKKYNIGECGFDYNCILDIPITKDNKYLIVLQDKIKAFIEYSTRYLEKLGIRKGGVSISTISKVIEKLSDWRNTNVEIKDNIKPILRELTVHDIPNKIYRGFFVSIEDAERAEKYNNKHYHHLVDKLKNNEIKQGDVLKYDFINPSSWSVDINQAIDFSNNHRDNLYRIVLSYRPKKEDIIADLRDSSISNITKYHNELELILDGGIRNYTVERITYDDKNKQIGGVEVLDGDVIKDNIYKILMMKSYKKIVDKEALDLALKYTLNKKTYNDIPEMSDFDDDTKIEKSLMKKLEKLYIRISTPLIFKILDDNNYMSVDNWSIYDWSVVDKDKILLYFNENTYCIVKFFNYDKLFRPIEYKIIKIGDDDKNKELSEDDIDDITNYTNDFLNGVY